MAENHHEPSYHIPQQNRRNKLRITNQEQQQQQPSSTLLPSLLQLNPPQNLPSSPPFYHLPLNLNNNNAQQQHNVVSVYGDCLKEKGNEVRSPVPLGPFTGYASILMRSRFLKPAQQTLDELSGVFNSELPSDFQFNSFSTDQCEVFRDFISFSDRIERSWKNSKLVLMLEEVYRKYKLYCEQMQSVVASFQTVAGLGNAAPYVSFAFNAISKHFSCLKNAIMNQMKVSGKTKTGGDGVVNKDTTTIQKPGLWTGEQLGPVWRSQRGLPDHAVAVFKTWLFENFLHPYPTDSEKQMLAQQTGLSRTQVSNWFINARVRLWKPMVEEIHMLETRQGRTPSKEVVKVSRRTQTQKAQQNSNKRPRNKCVSESSGGGGVSLALGLHQNVNNGNECPVSMPHHFNLQLDVEQDFKGHAQLMHDFVG